MQSRMALAASMALLGLSGAALSAGPGRAEPRPGMGKRFRFGMDDERRKAHAAHGEKYEWIGASVWRKDKAAKYRAAGVPLR